MFGGHLEQLFVLGRRAGLSSVVLGKVPLSAALVSIPLQGLNGRAASPAEDDLATGSLDVLPVGPLPPNPAEFVGSDALSSLLSDLEQRVDVVLVDAPLLGLSDTMTLSARVDALVVVTRLPYIRRSALSELNRVLGASPATKLGFVLTGAAAGEGYDAYGYEYASTGSARTTV